MLLQLSLKRCDSVSVLAGCCSLQRLLLEDCRRLTDLLPLTALSQLHTLLLRNCRNLANLGPVAQVCEPHPTGSSTQSARVEHRENPALLPAPPAGRQQLLCTTHMRAHGLWSCVGEGAHCV